ncbi:MAG: hypothetical protein ACOCXT_06775 [Candidatus Dojkabacteria bacterium]
MAYQLTNERITGIARGLGAATLLLLALSIPDTGNAQQDQMYQPHVCHPEYPPYPQPGSVCLVKGTPFWHEWEKGGLARNGYPITPLSKGIIQVDDNEVEIDFQIFERTGFTRNNRDLIEGALLGRALVDQGIERRDGEIITDKVEGNYIDVGAPKEIGGYGVGTIFHSHGYWNLYDHGYPLGPARVISVAGDDGEHPFIYQNFERARLEVSLKEPEWEFGLGRIGDECVDALGVHPCVGIKRLVRPQRPSHKHSQQEQVVNSMSALDSKVFGLMETVD